MTDKPQKTLPPGKKKKSVTRLGDFDLISRLGKGGMGEVFLARQISLDRQVALKTLNKELAKQEDTVRRFRREARAMAKIDHSNVVKVYAVDSYKGVHFVAIEYIDGKSVQDWLDKLGHLPVPDSVHIAVVCSEALRHAHAQNMVHRDVKPDNILITSKGIVKVADFGLAKVTDEDVSMTQSGQGLGTPLYMAPEQARSAKYVDQRCDIYALGATLYHLLTGQPPYAKESALELIISKETGVYPSARKLRPEIPERLDLIIDKMMAKDPKHRYKASEEVLRDLSGLGIHGEPLSFVEGAEHPVGGARGQAPTMAMTGATLGGTAGGLAMLPSGSHHTTSNRTWYVQYHLSDGQPVMETFSSRRTLKMINAGTLTPKARAKASSDGSYRPLAQFPEFAEAINRQLARKAATGQNEDIQSLYKQVDQAERSRLRWRGLSNRSRTLVGIAGLSAWIFAVALLGAVLFVGTEAIFRLVGQGYEELIWEEASDLEDGLDVNSDESNFE